MDIKLDNVADAVYVTLSTGKVAQTLEMNDRMNVDVDSSGNILAIEILDASNQQQLIENLQKNVASGVPIEIVTGTPVIG
jgi:uncharacterized protein YuzE